MPFFPVSSSFSPLLSFVVEDYRRAGLHQIQHKANPESLELWEQPDVCAGYLPCTESVW